MIKAGALKDLEKKMFGGSTKSVSKEAKAIVKTEQKVKEIKTKEKKKKQLKISPYPAVAFFGPRWSMDDSRGTAAAQNQFGVPTVYCPNRFSCPVGTKAVGWAVGTPQPMGHDTFINGYTDYKVYGAYVKLTVTNRSGKDCNLLIQFNADGKTPTINGTLVEDQKTRRNSWVYSIEKEQTKPFKFERYFDIREIQGLNKNQFNSDIGNFKGVLSTNAAGSTQPVYVPELCIAVANTEDATSVVVSWQIELDYVVQFMGRKKQQVKKTL